MTLRRQWGLASLLLAGCAAEPPKSTALEVGRSPPAEVLRCSHDVGPLAAPAGWPAWWPQLPGYEVALDMDGRKRMLATWQKAQDLATAGHCREACEGFRAIWRGAIAEGYWPKLIPLAQIGEECCAAGFSEFLPYHAPKICGSASDYPYADGKDPASGIFWIGHYLTGLVYFRYGQYEEAKTCFRWVPSTHGWAGAAADCLALIDELERPKDAKPAVPMTDD
ncbi:MAG: hypothetical protein U0414_39225 [Polyangiaceae bacterium]